MKDLLADQCGSRERWKPDEEHLIGGERSVPESAIVSVSSATTFFDINIINNDVLSFVKIRPGSRFAAR